ncbi:uncharacterized protein PGTG_12609 [Puccinia graminis f. sp. tritici CRL 75-36-700-3]|uniref:Uncharacterized protein n=1 Tax=Puccinia graminis f. sp. tritici (strain CRL 75-36-700-3 / race SCCL) TaxID=418459 RepID=E3KUV2_PUCGT|nr:uncharacterized protein PGTG_12609 [Puccinia graminis f. sp. tritici CRL 75-36-700-3]EFP88162.1 hypothetical protein PGTG_12609 [Puccinia graminis f. sp. tritici CRL 75-36-700-3]
MVSYEVYRSTSLEKCSDFADEQKFIGFIWNGENKTVRLTDKKLAERKEQIKLFLIQDADFKFNDAEVLAGRLNHVSFILPQLRCYIRSIYRWMNQWKKQWATRKIPEDVRVDLEFWISTLDTYTETRLCPASKPLEVHWVGDASTSFGIGVLIGQRWTQLRLKEDWRIATPPRTIAWLETVAIRIGILMLRETRNNIKGSNFIVYTDNTTTENVLASRKSKDHHSNEEWKIIQHLLISSELDLTPLRVVSKENVADGLSRGVRRPHEAVNRVWINIPDDLQHFMFHA